MARIKQAPSGNYYARIVIGHDETGKPIQKRFTHYDKAQLKLIIAQHEAKAGTAEHRRRTVGQALNVFLAGKEAVLSPSTIKAYTSMSETLKSKYGHFCALYADSITAQDAQAFISELIAAGSAPKTIKNYHGLLSAAFKFSGIFFPPVTLPQRKQPQLNIPEASDVSKLMKAITGTRLEIPVALASMGLRRSEICALSPSDLSGNVLHIHAATVYGVDNKTRIKATKNYSSDRYIQIPDALADKIRSAGVIWEGSPAALTNCFQRLIEREGFRHFRLHDLRHFFVSYCHNVLHLSDAQIQAITGHKTSVVMRANYLHAQDIEKSGRKVAKNMGKLL